LRNCLLPCLLLCLVHSSASAQGLLQLELLQPEEATTSTGTLEVKVKVTSTYPLEAVTAQVGTLSAPLQKSLSDTWSGRLDLGSLPWGNHTLTVSARDVGGQRVEVTRAFTLDRLPVVTLTQPAWETATAATVTVEASCQDDDPGGCAGQLEAQVVRYQTPNSTEPVLASGAQSLSATLELSAFDDGIWWVVVRLRATDGGVFRAFAARRIYVARPPRYHLVGEATYPLIDFDAERFLATRDAEEFILQRRATGAVEHRHTLTEGLPDRELRVGALTPMGALFRGKDGQLYEWKGASLIDHGEGAYGYPLPFIVQGPWIAIKDTLRNETTGQVWRPPYGILALSPRGEVASVSSGSRDVYGFKEGALRKVAETSYDPSSNGHLRDMATDGYHYVWVEKARPRTDEVVYLAAGTTRQELTRGGGGFGMYPGRILVNEGYIAYSKGTFEQGQVFLRKPDGVELQLSFFSKSATPEALSPNGEVALISGERRHLGRWEQVPLEIGPRFGQVRFFQGEWYLLAGRGLFRVVFQPGERPAPGPVWTPPPGQWATDGGLPEPDGGLPEPDGGPPAPDAGTPPGDDPGGPGDEPPPGKDPDSCAMAGSSSAALMAWVGVLVLLGLCRRRGARY
jgi:hypothetical protein